MKNPGSTPLRVRLAIADLVIYGNLAFTFIFFSAAFDRGCSNETGRAKDNNVVAAAAKNNASNPLLSEKGQSKPGVVEGIPK